MQARFCCKSLKLSKKYKQIQRIFHLPRNLKLQASSWTLVCICALLYLCRPMYAMCRPICLYVQVAHVGMCMYLCIYPRYCIVLYCIVSIHLYSASCSSHEPIYITGCNIFCIDAYILYVGYVFICACLHVLYFYIYKALLTA